jgi:membrane-associated phospholipid phosphatase
MENIFSYGVTWNVLFQNLDGWLKTPMEIFSFFGNEYFFLLLLPALYWCIEARLGLRVGIILLLSTSLNDALKMVFHAPRPYWVSSEVIGYARETSFGVPSGHAQIAAGVWGMLAVGLRKWWAWVIVILLILLIGVSRLYLGVHFLQDVVAGWIIGALLLLLVLGVWKPVVGWCKKVSPGQQILLSFLSSLVFILISLVPFLWLKNTNWQAPPPWAQYAQEAVTLSGSFTTAGTFFGLLAGLIWLSNRGGFDARGTPGERILRYLLGLLGVLLFYFGLKILFGIISPDSEAVLPYILRYIRYVLVGAWVSAGAPWIFIKLKLARVAA